MCGIAAYVGRRPALPILLDALERVEYRGYDSCGVAVCAGDRLHVVKDVGPVEGLRRRVPLLDGVVGIGHTRWATVGAPSVLNAHPHTDCRHRVAIVHNGDLGGHAALRRRLEDAGHTLRSQTDSELLAHLVEEQYADGGNGNLPLAVARALAPVEGTYAVAVAAAGFPGVVVARRESPVVIGLAQGEYFAASDAPALLEHTRRVVHLEDGDVAVLLPDGVDISHHGQPVQRRVHHIRWDPQELGKAGYEHYMLKEVYEQPRALRNALAGRLLLTEGRVALETPLPPAPREVLLLGCGTSYHAALLGEHLLSDVPGIPARARVASESAAGAALKGAWALGLSQSGETADTIAALRRAREQGAWTLALTNVPTSSLARIAHATLELRAGPEVSVAATKTFLAQVACLALLALALPAEAGAGSPSASRRQALLSALHALPSRVQRLLDDTSAVQGVAQALAPAQHLFLVARGTLHPVALEGALKLKEVAYLHAEGFPAGELKHGPFALLGPGTPVVALLAHDAHYERMLATVKEVKARGAPVIALAPQGDTETAALVDRVVSVPATDPLLAPAMYGVAVQLLAYYVARERGCPIDRPRNLAKSVTVY